MLYLYIGKENLPKDKKFIFDVEELVPSIRLYDDPWVKEVLKESEEATRDSDETFRDRFGRGLWYVYLSTNTKIILTSGLLQDYVVNGIEMGYRGFQTLCEIGRGHIYLPNNRKEVPDYGQSVTLNGELFDYEKFVEVYDDWKSR